MGDDLRGGPHGLGAEKVQEAREEGEADEGEQDKGSHVKGEVGAAPGQAAQDDYKDAIPEGFFFFWGHRPRRGKTRAEGGAALWAHTQANNDPRREQRASSASSFDGTRAHKTTAGRTNRLLGLSFSSSHTGPLGLHKEG